MGSTLGQPDVDTWADSDAPPTRTTILLLGTRSCDEPLSRLP